MSFFEKLKDRWGLNSFWQVFLVLLVFALTGFTVLFAKKPLVSLIDAESPDHNLWISVVYYILILPVYQVLLLFYAFLFGQFRFFWAFEKKTFKRMKGLFVKDSRS